MVGLHPYAVVTPLCFVTMRLVQPERAQFHPANAQFTAGKTCCKNSKGQKKFAPIDHELQRAFSCRRDWRKVSLRQTSAGVVDNVDREFVRGVRHDSRHGKVESRLVVSCRVPQMGTENEVAISSLKIENQCFAIAESAAGAHNVD